jgi:hypothetical protein
LPQPKLKLGVPPPAGLACSLRVAAAAVAPVVQAFTVQRTCLPRSLLACAAVTSTQRAALAAAGVGFAVAESAGVALFDVVAVAEGFDVVVVDVVAVVEGVAEPDVPECTGAADVLWVGVAVGVRVVLAGVGVGVGEVDVGVGVAEGLGLDDGTGNCSGSHDCSPATVAALAVIAARVASEAVVSRTLPATRATAAGRGCTNRMKAHRCCSLLLGTAHSTTPVLTRMARIITARGKAAGLLPAGGGVRALEGINERTVMLQPPCVACRVHFCDALRAEREASGAVNRPGDGS